MCCEEEGVTNIKNMTWLSRFAWAVLIYNVLVILWGAVVRITGAGAGCGDHWPLCNGAVLPIEPSTKTMIEYSHRLTSSLSGLLGIVLVVLSFRLTGKGHPMRTGALWSLGLVILEGLVGGVQVLLGLTAESTHPARGFVQGIHLANTFTLLGALLLTAFWASGGPVLKWRGQGKAGLASLLGLLALLLLGVTGAVTALGDLLFTPHGSSTPLETVKRDFAATATILENLRVLHPLLAILISAYLAMFAVWLRRWRPHAEVRRWSLNLWVVLGVQMLAGFANIWLRAPDWMQLLHLLLSCLLWLTLLTLVYRALTALVLAPKVSGRGSQGSRQESKKGSEKGSEKAAIY